MAVSCVCTMKKTAWVYWVFNTIFSAAYSGVALTTFYNIQHVTDNMSSDTKTETTTLRNGLLASCMLGFLIVLFFIIYSFLVLIARFFGDVKLAYGIMLGCCIHTAWFQLLAGLVLQNANDWFKGWKDVGAWSSSQYSTYQATFGLSYFLVGFYIIGFIILLFARKHMGRGNELPTTASGTPANVYLDMQKSGSMQRSVQI